jgi:hypothetical protein
MTVHGWPVHSFQTLLGDLATLTRYTIVSEVAGAGSWSQDAVPTPLQAKIFELLTSHPMP